jgi:hypothetical protein
MTILSKVPFNTMRVKRVQLDNQVQVMTNAGVPANGTTGAGVAGKGSLCVDTTNGKLYINTNTLASPTWVVAGTQT